MSQTVFWVGLSWRVVESKWPGTCEVFQGFDPTTIANLTPDEINVLASDKRVIRHRSTIQSIAHNAGRLLELDELHGGFRDYLLSHGETTKTVEDVSDNFKYLGEMSACQFLYSVSVIDEDGTLSQV